MGFFKKVVDKVEGKTEDVTKKGVEAGKGIAGMDDIMKYVKGVNFPATKDSIVSAFKTNNAPQELMSALNSLPAMNFNSPQDLINALKGKLSGI